MLPVAAGSGNPNGASLLERLAERIARNREVLGLHYRSDTLAGVFLAKQTLALLVQCSTVKDLLPGVPTTSRRRSGHSPTRFAIAGLWASEWCAHYCGRSFGAPRCLRWLTIATTSFPSSLRMNNGRSGYPSVTRRSEAAS